MPTAYATVDYAQDRPGPDWWRHGRLERPIWVLHLGKLCRVVLRKQRWLHRDTGRTRHDRPAWDLPGSPYGLDVVFTVLGLWLGGVLGLHHLQWPWPQDRPSRRTVQRFRGRLAPTAAAWLQAIRAAASGLLSPRTLDEVLPMRARPPPGGGARREPRTATAWQLHDGATTLEKAAHALSISPRALLQEAQRRHPTLLPQTR